MTEQTARAAEETAREVAHPWCVDDGNCEEDASSNDHSAECDMLTGQIVAAIQSERASADRRVNEALEAAAKVADAEATCGCGGAYGRCNIDDAPLAIAAAIRALKSSES